MGIKDFIADHFVKILALVCLFVGLSDAAKLLGVTELVDPLSALGTSGFIILAIVTLSRLFAAVGLWLGSSWGGALLIGATVLELGAIVSGGAHLHISVFGQIVRTTLLAGILGLFLVRFMHAREHVHH